MSDDPGMSEWVTAPFTGTVVSLGAEPGEAVGEGTPLVVLEAMKMEMPLQAPRAGRIRAVNAAAGDSVARGAIVVELHEVEE